MACRADRLVVNLLEIMSTRRRKVGSTCSGAKPHNKGWIYLQFPKKGIRKVSNTGVREAGEKAKEVDPPALLTPDPQKGDVPHGTGGYTGQHWALMLK